jgi:hypothetical protein
MTALQHRLCFTRPVSRGNRYLGNRTNLTVDRVTKIHSLGGPGARPIGRFAVALQENSTSLLYYFGSSYTEILSVH